MFAALLFGGERLAHATTFEVDSVVDSVDANPGDGVCDDGSGKCTLRAAIMQANYNPDADTIILPAGTYTLTIPGVNEDASATGDLDISSDVTISGAGANATTINGGGIDRVLHVYGTATVDISGLTVTGGIAPSITASGGGIQAHSTSLTLTNVTVDDNEADDGGGIFVGGPITLNNCTVSNNTALAGGFGGGGILNYINGPLTLNNSTVSGNMGHFAGGIVTTSWGPTLTLNNSTMSLNGGGLYNAAGTVIIRNTILADSGPSGNCTFQGGTLTSLGHNLSTDVWCEPAHLLSGGLGEDTDINDTPAGLAPLFLNQPGRTKTHALCTGPGIPDPSCTDASPAIDHVPAADCTVATDQRGVPRPQDGDGDGSPLCDIGAFEDCTLKNFCVFCSSVPCSTGTPWSLKVQWGAGVPLEANCPAVPMAPASNALDMATGLVSCINATTGPTIVATITVAGPLATCFDLVGPSVPAASANVCVGSAGGPTTCCAPLFTPQNLNGCQFNPELFEVALTGSDCNGNGVDDTVDILAGTSLDANGNAVPDECDPPCRSLDDCADLNGDNIRDEACAWYDCDAGTCGVVVKTTQADLGGSNGACPVDTACDGNDRFHALNCFSDKNTMGVPPYPCEPNTPFALNVDAGGPATCVLDGVCDGNDAFHALNCFENDWFDGSIGYQCTCPAPGPAPQFAASVKAEEQVGLVLRAPATARPGDAMAVDVHLEGGLEALRGYQLHLGASGGESGKLELVDIAVDTDRRDWVFAEAPATWSAFNRSAAQMVVGMDAADGVPAPAGSYLATFTYRVPKDAAGSFTIDVRYDSSSAMPQDRTFLFGRYAGLIDVTLTKPAVITVEVTRAEPGRR